MDHHTFDSVARSVAAATSRRRAVKVIAGGVLGAVGLLNVQEASALRCPRPGDVTFCIQNSECTVQGFDRCCIRPGESTGRCVNCAGRKRVVVKNGRGDCLCCRTKRSNRCVCAKYTVN